MAIVIDGNNTPTAGGIGYGDGTELAFTAAGSAGGVLYSAGSSAPAFSAAGSAGQLLQSNGASAPSWATVASSPMVLITTTTASAASQVAFTGLSSTYVKYIIELTNVSSSNNNANLYIRTSTNNGSSYDSSASDYVWLAGLADQGTATMGIANSTVATEIRVGVSISNVVNDGGINIQFNLINPSAATRTVMYWDGGYVNAGPNYVRVLGTGVRNSTSGAVNAVQLLPGSGTFTGTFKLYGVL
jgi:hypothetical protein